MGFGFKRLSRWLAVFVKNNLCVPRCTAIHTVELELQRSNNRDKIVVGTIKFWNLLLSLVNLNSLSLYKMRTERYG
jgi:hypothetical protein